MILIFSQLYGIELFCALLVAHALCDFPLQGDFLAQAKDPTSAVGKEIWPTALFMHGLIHAGAVWMLTGSFALAVAEFYAHVMIDLLKSFRIITFNQDQLAHVVCKVAWVLLATVSV